MSTQPTQPAQPAQPAQIWAQTNLASKSTHLATSGISGTKNLRELYVDRIRTNGTSGPVGTNRTNLDTNDTNDIKNGLTRKCAGTFVT